MQYIRGVGLDAVLKCLAQTQDVIPCLGTESPADDEAKTERPDELLQRIADGLLRGDLAASQGLRTVSDSSTGDSLEASAETMSLQQDRTPFPTVASESASPGNNEHSISTVTQPQQEARSTAGGTGLLSAIEDSGSAASAHPAHGRV